MTEFDISKIAVYLATRFEAKMIILFGSRARDDFDEKSDVDLLIVCDFVGSRRQLIVEIDRSLRGCGFARDIVVLTPFEFERDKHLPGTIARPAWLEGRLLYDAA